MGSTRINGPLRLTQCELIESGNDSWCFKGGAAVDNAPTGGARRAGKATEIATTAKKPFTSELALIANCPVARGPCPLEATNIPSL